MSARPAKDQPPLLQPHRGGEGGAYSRPLAGPPAGEVEVSLTYINLMNQFNRLDEQEMFSMGANRLYTKLLDRCSRLYWKNPFKQADGYLSAICGNWSKNTLKKHRAELERRGLLRHTAGGNGAGDLGIYKLLIGREAVQAAEVDPAMKVSNSDTLFETLPDETGGMVSDKVSGKVSDKGSIIDTNKRSKTQDEVTALSGAAPALEKKIGQGFLQASASHTGGGARPAAAARPAPGQAEERLVPTPLEEGESIPAFVDPRLPADNPARWVGRPESIEMVADFYRTHPDPAQQAKAPRAHLFYNHYHGQGWKKGNGQTITDWRSVAEGYKCVESYGSATSKPGAGGSGAAGRQNDRYQSASAGGFGSFSGASRKGAPGE